MSASATIEFDHVAATAVAHVTGATVGHTYALYCFDHDSGGVTHLAAATSFDITVTGIGTGGIPGLTQFGCVVYDQTSGDVVANTVFPYTSDSQYSFVCTWSYDGADTVTVEFQTEVGKTYEMDTFNWGSFASGNNVAGDGTVKTLTAVKTGGSYPGAFMGELYAYSGPYNDYSVRVFEQGVAGAGSLGNPNNNDVQTLPASNVGVRTATLNGNVNPQGVSSTAWFEYGLSETSYAFSTPAQSVGSGSDGVDVSAEVTGLLPGRTYHYRLVRNP